MKINYSNLANLSDSEKEKILERLGADFSEMESINYDSHFSDDWVSPEEIYAIRPELVDGIVTGKAFRLAVLTQKRNGWENSDIPYGTQKDFEVIAEHYEKCPECENNFESIQFKGTLIDLAYEHFNFSDYSGWICSE